MHLLGWNVICGRNPVQNSRQYRGWARCRTGVWLALSPTATPPFKNTKTANAVGTTSSGHSWASSTLLFCRNHRRWKVWLQRWPQLDR